ncbi:MAG: rhodanese-like domain-containing protein [Hyphomicrobiaceae bacterium]
MPITKGYKQLMAEAAQRVKLVSIEQAKALLDDPDVLFVDIRETGELKREGTIPGAFHASRGMIEFWVDPESPYFKKKLGNAKKIVLFCASAWRSTLTAAALVDMGLDNVSHLEGGFSAWKKAEAPIADWDSRTHTTVQRT